MDSKQILQAIEEEISRLQQVRDLLSTVNGHRLALENGHKVGLPAPKKRILSEDARNRIAQAKNAAGRSSGRKQLRRRSRRRSQAMLKVKFLHPEAKLPSVSYAGSDLGYDLYSIEDVILHPGIPVRVRTGIAVEGWPGFGFVLGDRSSMAAKGVTYAGGRIDAGYRGEILVCLVNVNQPQYSLQYTKDKDGCLTGVTLEQSDVSVAIRKGDKIVQISPFRAMTEGKVIQVEELSVSDRDIRGFGSSGR